MKKIFMAVLLIISFVIFPCRIYSENLNHTFPVYSNALSTQLYPKIETYIDDLQIKAPFDNKRAQQITTEIYKIIIETFKENKDKKFVIITQPVVAVYKMNNNDYDIYVLQLILNFYDVESSISNVLVSNMIFGKKFIVFVIEKNTIEV